MKTTIGQRLKSVLEHFYQGRQTLLAEKSGVSQKNISNYVRVEAPNNPGADKLIAIGLATPGLNMKWLLIGEGEMLEKDDDSKKLLEEQRATYEAKSDGFKHKLELCKQENEFLKQSLKDKERVINILEKRLK